MGLEFARVFQDALDGIRRLPEIAAGEVVTDRGGFQGVVEIEQPVGDVDPVDHQIGQDAAAEVPEPAPVSEPIFVKRLVGRIAQEILPGDLLRVDF